MTVDAETVDDQHEETLQSSSKIARTTTAIDIAHSRRVECTPPCQGTPDDELSLLRAENARLLAQLQEQPGKLAHPGVLGVQSASCGGCGAMQGVTERAFVELGKLYCETCWNTWERCGWWQPTVRVNTKLPKLGASGQASYGPQDAFLIPGFACASDDFSLLSRLRDELPEGKEFTDWNGARHMGVQFEGDEARHTQASAPKALREMVEKLEHAFGIKASATRLNLYRSTDDYKTLHQDRGQDSSGIPQVTVGLSLGATREIAFAHWWTGLTMTFPLVNGSVYAFTPELNKVFLHGIPKVDPEVQASSGPADRLSLILWGSRISEQHTSEDCQGLSRVAA